MSSARVGTCSWTDPTLTESGLFYPALRMTAEQRLKFYASNFDTVEVDSTFYALPSEKVVGLQTQRTPDDFTLHYKAFGLLTQHMIDPRRLPKIIKEMLPSGMERASRLGYKQVPEKAKEMAWQMFDSALLPAESASKLGVVLFQFPPYFSFSPSNQEYILECKARLKHYRLAIEFRHSSWLTEENRAETQSFLKSNQLVYVCVDEPQFDGGTTVPPIVFATSDIAYVRFHGRNTSNWYKKGISVAERYAYEYTEDELADWVHKLEKISPFTNETYVMFNNCFHNYAVKNAMQLAQML
ncbi:MAG TPA: DUF72 domain-containing protein [Actinobacteria bacterium]|nr:DUF72 domain-containing protein [Actinomycetota bacterium]